MINPGTYENTNLEEAAIKLSSNFELALVYLVLKSIKYPRNINKETKKARIKTEKAINKFENDYKDWIDNILPVVYTLGIKHADNLIKKIGGKILNQNKIYYGDLLINVPGIVSIPDLSNQVLINFKNYPKHITFLNEFRKAAYYSLNSKPLQILRKANDIFRQVAIEVGSRDYLESSIFTRRKMSQALLDKFREKGLLTITYKDGKKMPIESYSEMLGRTITGRTALQAALNRYTENGYSFGIVSSHFRACPLCTPYENTILSLDGKSDQYESIADAETQGLFHPNCLHTISPFIDGISAIDMPSVSSSEQRLIDEYGYNEAQKMVYLAQQKQRYVERTIRKYKKKSNLSLDSKDKKKSNDKVKEWQKIQREHLKENTYLPRKYSREQIKKAH